MSRKILAFSVFGLAFFLCSCLYTTHHFNTGKTLDLGRTRATLGVGQHQWNNSTLAKTSINYRIGAADRLGPFIGMDMGLHLEMPTNPGTMEFDVKLGLPAGKWKRFLHSFSTGWGIGMWADNTLFAEYAFSRTAGKHLMFSNLRLTYLATQFFKVFEENIDQPFAHNQRLIYQAGAGLFYVLPDLPVLPDFIIPQLVVTYPQVPAGMTADDLKWIHQLNLNIGTGWNF